jgi:hypothetical protein
MVAGKQMLVMAGGAQLQKWLGPGKLAGQATSQPLANTGVGGPPPSADFVCAIAQRLVAQYSGTSGQIRWSGPLEDYENWDMSTGGAGFVQAAAKPDPIVAMLDNTNEVFCFGTETLQVFAPAALNIDVNDPTNLLDFAPSRTMNIGTVSPYAVVAVDDMFAMLDRQRRFIFTDARTYTDISRPVAKLLRDLKSISDAWGFRMRFGRFDCIVWFFPTDGFGLTYDTQTQNWSEWREQATAGSVGLGIVSDVAPSITCAYNWSEKGALLVGMSDGRILKLDDDSSVDSDGTAIRVEVVSGFNDHGSTAQKHCHTLMLTFKRTFAALPAGAGGLSASGHVRISKRDNQGAWKIVKDQELSYDTAPAIQIRSLGVYRTRQWKVEYSGEDELQLVSAQEEYEILGA